MTPEFLGQILDNHGDLLQQLALLAYLHDESHGKPFLEAVTAAKVCQSLYKTLSKDDVIEAARNETVQRIAHYVKANPYARPQEIQAKVQEEISLFKLKIQLI